MFSLIVKTVVGFGLVIGGLVGLAAILDFFQVSRDARPWVASTILAGAIAFVIYWLVIRRSSAMKKVMGPLNDRITSANEPGDFMRAWADMAAVMFSDSLTSPLPLTLASIERIERDFKDIDVNKQFPVPQNAVKTTLAIGAFIGEYIRAQVGGSWEKKGDFDFCLVVTDEVRLQPMSMVVQFFAKEGNVSLVEFSRLFAVTRPEDIGDARLASCLTKVSALTEERNALPPSDERVVGLDAQIAATVFSAYDQRDQPLPYSAESVQLIERLLLTKPALSMLKTDGYAQAVGAFLGESIRHKLGGTWVFDAEAGLWLLRVTDQLTCNPIIKVSNFFDKGSTESLDSFFRGTIAMTKLHGGQS
jgi:phosphate/sulfate permease